MKRIISTYSHLPDILWEHSQLRKFHHPSLIKFNDPLAKTLSPKLSSLENSKLASIFSGQELLDNSKPISLAYAGHQFGHFVPQLGDGRATLIAEIKNDNDEHYDIQLKGSGRTFYSRGGDGLCGIGPAIREYILSEAMYALNIPTTRALAIVKTGEEILRDQYQPGAVITRVAKGHIRVGTFEFLASRKLTSELKELADYCISRFYPDLENKDQKYLELFRAISENKLTLVAKWMSIGFIHGVMNTDNTSITGETIDYGPCAFMDQFEHDKVFSSIDRNSRYAYNNQGQIAQWNLSSLANCFIPLINDQESVAVELLRKELERNSRFFDQVWIKTMGNKLGILNPLASDLELINEYLVYLEKNQLDFTNSFRTLSEKINEQGSFYSKWSKRILDQGKSSQEIKDYMNAINPFIIARNHQVQNIIDHALEGDFTPMHDLIQALQSPYKTDELLLKYTHLPTEDEIVHQTFCGT
ncbi:YdiU family protein [Halobacteriovorax sp. HLS]|uniref:protein adenylyltransferase SelO n=1 Tax=Halobacteriovorax sp. HLS TaxID=2234000 RepID=UPI000FDAFB37|nr:YdiU family protein [Halobacteriovorax sp. HLS]